MYKRQDIHLDLSNTSFPINPFGYNYAYDNLSKRELFIYPENGSAPLVSSLINLTFEKNVTNMTVDVAPGNDSLLVYATFADNTTYDSIFRVADNGSSFWKFETLDGNITLEYGHNYAGGDYRSGVSHLQVDGNITVGVKTTLGFTGTEIIEVGSQFTTEIMDILGKAWIIKSLYLFRE